MDQGYRALAARLAAIIDARVPRPRVVAIAGAQGTGKSTLAASLVDALRARGLQSDRLSLDDFYLPHAARVQLAATVHPLFATRGVPGTHDVAALEAALEAVLEDRIVAVPVFDKGRDDRAAARRQIRGPLDVAVVEGWCLAARPQSEADLAAPVNALERDEDGDSRFRRAVNDALAGRYQHLFARFDYVVYLAAAGIDDVVRFRAEQEGAVAPALRMDDARLRRFIAHYERLTAWMARDLPGRADAVVALAADRSYSVQGGAHRLTS